MRTALPTLRQLRIRDDRSAPLTVVLRVPAFSALSAKGEMEVVEVLATLIDLALREEAQRQA